MRHILKKQNTIIIVVCRIRLVNEIIITVIQGLRTFEKYKNTPVYWTQNAPINQECFLVSGKRLVGLNADYSFSEVWRASVNVRNLQLLRTLTATEAYQR